jgi:GNAT superfamily N-acetyltransferase
MMSEKYVRGSLRTILRRYPEAEKLNLLDQGDASESVMKWLIKDKPYMHTRIRVCLVLHNGTPVGWGWRFRQEHIERNSCMLYVLPAYRSVGFGEQIFKRIIEKNIQTEVYPWDSRSKGAYAKIEERNGLSLRKAYFFPEI